MSFGERITELRKKNGVTQEQLAEKIGVTRQTISKWELDQSTPDLEYISILSDNFNVSTDYLIKGSVDNGVESIEVQKKDAKSKEKTESKNIALTIIGIIFIIFGSEMMRVDNPIHGIPVVFVGTELIIAKKHPKTAVICAILSLISCIFATLLVPNIIKKMTIQSGSQLTTIHYNFYFSYLVICALINMALISIQGLLIGYRKNYLYNVFLSVVSIAILLYTIIFEKWERNIDVIILCVMSLFNIFISLNHYIESKRKGQKDNEK